ncbi:hypothetical protein ACFVVX_08070 [Kitasatospora sp. NPDC058170]|uniref:Rv1733c family protein n=1 Tax=Kitasatospora sp. NPDC058170 TaxID=3346364 RepID=UPI0036DDFA85
MPSTPHPPRPASRPRRAARQLRRTVGSRSDPLVRPVDRARGRALLAAALGLLLALLTATGAALLAHRLTDRHAAADRARLHRVEAVLLTDPRHAAAAAGRRAGGYGNRADVEAAWTSPDGQPRTGTLTVPRTARTGDTVTAWVDGAGAPADAPATPTGLVVDAVCTGLFALVGLTGLVGGGLALRLRVLDRRAELAWQRSWARLEPGWSGRTSHHRPGPGGPPET